MEKKKLLTHFIVGIVLSVIAVVIGGWVEISANEKTMSFGLVLKCILSIPFGLILYMLIKLFVDWGWYRIPHSHSLGAHISDFLVWPIVGVGGGVYLGFKLLGKFLG